jgi:two-component sensor histidine kinase
MMKVKITFKNIFLRTAGTFFIFYFIAAIVFTGIYYKSKVDENNAKFDNMGSVLQDRITKNIYDIEYESIIDEAVNKNEGIKSGEKIKTYNFNAEGIGGLRKIEIGDNFYPYWEVNYRKDVYSTNNSDYLYKKTFQRYNDFTEYDEDELRSLMDNKGHSISKLTTTENFSRIDNKIYYKVNYEYINTLYINGHQYYLCLKADYYPWEEILPKAIPLYLISFIMVLGMTIVLSKGLYKTYEKQEALEKNRRELTSAIAHELKTPLGIIRTYGEGLKEKIAEDKRDKYLEVIIDETYKMDKMVLEMLDLSKLEAKAYKLKKENFCINNLIEEIMKKNEKVFNDKSINVNYTSDKKYYIDADYVRIEQVINNLLSNAIYHTEENKSINIELNNGKFIIENEGELISKDKIELIWDTFYRGDSSRDRSERRTGIGLAIVKNVLQLHNFKFGVENTTIGVRFWFEF